MHKIMRIRKYRHMLNSLLTVILLTIFMTGCGRDEALEEYKTNIETFTTNISDINDRINNIDLSSETHVADFLSCMDELKEEFAWFAELDVPEQFASVESLADDAGEYMAEAVSLYHQAFEAETLDTALLDVASENYKRANKRISYISSILQGEIPEGDGVSVEYIDEDTAD